MELSMSSRPLGRWLFGKLPALGDFLSRGLDFDLRDAIDHWLSSEMETARARFGAGFDARYFTAPAWCFVDCDPAGLWSGGALCASVDAAGRLFPIMAGAPANDVDEAVALAGGMLELLYAALAQSWSADRLHDEPLAPAGLPWQPSAAGWAVIGEGGPPVQLPGRFPRRIVECMVELAA
jgi:type VI secretion system ImpM family protein